MKSGGWGPTGLLMTFAASCQEKPQQETDMAHPYDLVIENGTIHTPTSTYKANIAVRDGKIVAIGGAFEDAARRVDAG